MFSVAFHQRKCCEYKKKLYQGNAKANAQAGKRRNDISCARNKAQKRINGKRVPAQKVTLDVDLEIETPEVFDVMQNGVVLCK